MLYGGQCAYSRRRLLLVSHSESALQSNRLFSVKSRQILPEITLRRPDGLENITRQNSWWNICVLVSCQGVNLPKRKPKPKTNKQESAQLKTERWGLGKVGPETSHKETKGPKHPEKYKKEKPTISRKGGRNTNIVIVHSWCFLADETLIISAEIWWEKTLKSTWTCWSKTVSNYAHSFQKTAGGRRTEPHQEEKRTKEAPQSTRYSQISFLKFSTSTTKNVFGELPLHTKWLPNRTLLFSSYFWHEFFFGNSRSVITEPNCFWNYMV